MKDGKNRVRQIKEQPANSPHRVIEHISNEVGNSGNKVVNHHEHIYNQVIQNNEDVSNKCQCRHKCPANNTGCGNRSSGEMINRRHSRIEQGYKGDNQNNDPYQGASIQGPI